MWIFMNFCTLKAEIYPKSRIQRPKIGKSKSFRISRIPEIDFTENLSDTKKLKFPHCGNEKKFFCYSYNMSHILREIWVAEKFLHFYTVKLFILDSLYFLDCNKTVGNPGFKEVWEAWWHVQCNVKWKKLLIQFGVKCQKNEVLCLYFLLFFSYFVDEESNLHAE